MKEEYGIGGWTFQFEEGVTGWVDWNARGLSIKKFHDEDNSVVKLSWLQVEKRIGQIIENDQYFLESEKVEVEPVAEETADEDAEINDEIELDENLDEEEMQESLIEPQSRKGAWCPNRTQNKMGQSNRNRSCLGRTPMKSRLLFQSQRNRFL